MPIKLTIEIAGPLDAEDRDLLSGVAVMTLAIANHEMAREHFPETFNDDDGLKPTAPPESGAPCGFINPDDPSYICVGKAGHRGRHKFRQVATSSVAATLPN